jgi:hypothetical protein
MSSWFFGVKPDPGLRGADAAPITGETELSPDRGLDAVTVKYLSLDGRGV